MDGSKTEVKQNIFTQVKRRPIARAYGSRFTFYKVSYIGGGGESLSTEHFV